MLVSYVANAERYAKESMRERVAATPSGKQEDNYVRIDRRGW